MPGPIDALKTYFAPGGTGTPQSPYSPWQKTLQTGVETGTQGLLGAVGLGDDSLANRGGALVGASVPFLGGIKGMMEKGLGGAMAGLRGAAPEEAGAAFHTPSLPPGHPVGAAGSFDPMLAPVGEEGLYNDAHALPPHPHDAAFDQYTKLMPKLGGQGKP